MIKDLNTIIIHHKPVDALVLKRLFLIFDRIWFINPVENLNLIPSRQAEFKYDHRTFSLGSYGTLYNGEKFKKLDERLLDEFDYAYNKGFLKIPNLRANNFFKENWFSLRLAYDFDTADIKLLEKSKKLLDINKNASCSDGLLRGGFIAPSGVKIYPDIPEPPKLFNDEDNQIYKLEIQLFSIIGKINRSLAICGEYDLIPTFIDDTINDIFNEKVEIAKKNNDSSVQKTFYKKNNFALNNVQHLLYSISELMIPNHTLKTIPLKELIIARNNTFHELSKLRRQLIKNTNFLLRNQFDRSFRHEAKSFIENEFKPQLDNYHSKFRATFQRCLKYSGVLTFCALSSSTNLIQSLSPTQIVYLSAISAAVGTAVSDLPGHFREKRNKKFNNTFGYFLRFDNEKS